MGKTRAIILISAARGPVLQLNFSDVVETVTFETETSSKRQDQDRDFIKISETSKFVDFAKIFQKNVVKPSNLNFIRISDIADLFWLFLTCKQATTEIKLLELQKFY